MLSPEKQAIRDIVQAHLSSTDFAGIASFGEHKEKEPKDGKERKPSAKDDNSTFATVTIPMDASKGINVAGVMLYPSSMTLQISAFHLSPVPYAKGEPETKAASASQERLQALLAKAAKPAKSTE